MRLMKSLFLIWMCLSGCVFSATIKEIKYSCGGNFKALVLYPDKLSAKMPVIIYNYHEDLDRGNQFRVYQNAHDVTLFMKVFASWGAICVVPMDRFHQTNAIRGAIRYVKSLPRADANNIHVIGISEGGFMSLLAVQPGDGVKSLTLLMPRSIHNTGALSFPGLMHAMPKIKIPIMIMLANQSADRSVKSSRLINTVLEQQRKQVTLVEYSEIDRWFWKPQKEYMQKIYETILYKETKNDLPNYWGEGRG